MTTLLDLNGRVAKIYVRDDQDINVEINATYKEMLAAIGHHKLEDRIYKNVVSGQFESTLPDSFLRINHPIKLIDPQGGTEATSSYPLMFINKDEYDYWESAPDLPNPSTGIPWAYCLYKNSIYLTSIPDRTYTLEINLGGEPDDLLADSDQSILSSTWDETIIAGALKRLYANVKLYDDSKFWGSIYLHGHAEDGGTLVGGLKLLQQIDRDNYKSAIVVKNQPL